LIKGFDTVPIALQPYCLQDRGGKRKISRGGEAYAEDFQEGQTAAESPYKGWG